MNPNTNINCQRRSLLAAGAAAATTAWLPATVQAQAQSSDPVKIGLILPMSGPFASTGRQIDAAVKLYQKTHGTQVAGRRVEVILRDDGGTAPDATARIARELVTRDKVQVLAGFGLTPLAFAAAPVATQAKTPMIVMAAATAIIPQRSPYIVRTSVTMGQITAPLAPWAVKEGIRSVITFVADYGPGLDAEKIFIKHFEQAGGKVLDAIRTPLVNPDYAPFLQRTRDLKPDAVFVFVPSGEGTNLLKQYNERGLKQAGIRIIGTGDMLDDDLMPAIGEISDGMVTTHWYSAAHDSPENKAYVAAFMRDNNGNRPNFMSVGGYDGIHLVYEALKKTGGDANGDKLLAAMKGMRWMSVRGPIAIDPDTRDIVQDIYFRRAQLVNGQMWNIEFDKVEQYKDPGV